MMREVALVATCLTLFGGFTHAGWADDYPGIPLDTVTDFLHSLIDADRTFYTIHLVQRMQKQGSITASETWSKDKTTLPLPAQFLREANDLATMTGTRVRLRLISLWPLNPQNAPASDIERQNLETVRQHPERAATSTVKVDQQTYLQAIYADRAVTQACIGCHNAHPRSPKHDFKINDIMGGMVIEIPLKPE